MRVLSPIEKARIYIESHSKSSEDSEQKKHKPITGPCITFSRQTGAGADAISEKLAQFLQLHSANKEYHWTVFNRNLVEEIIKEHNLPERLSSFLIEDKISAISTMMNQLFGLHPPQWTIVHSTTQTILQIAELGFSIIVGRGANIITQKFLNCIHIRLVGPIEERILHTARVYNLNRKEAIRFIQKEDGAREKYVYSNFRKNIDDPLLYHMIINSGLLSFDDAAVLIGNFIIKKFPAYFDKK